MTAWLRVLGLFVAVVVAALLLKALPPLIVLALFVAGVVYANHLLTRRRKDQPARTSAEMLGLRSAPDLSSQVLASPFALLGRGNGVDVRDVMVGSWRGTQVQLFGLSARLSAPAGVAVEERAYSCAIAPTGAERSHLIVEPRSFLTPDADRAPLPEISLGAESFDRAFAVQAVDEAFAREVLDDGTRAWLLGSDRWGFEVNDRSALVFGAPVRPADLDLVLETMGTLLTRLGEIAAPATVSPPAPPPPRAQVSAAPSAASDPPSAASDALPERPDLGGPSGG